MKLRLHADAETRVALRALGQHAVQHCPHRLGLSERWRRDLAEERAWRIMLEPCAACAELAAVLRLTLEPAGAPAVAAQKG